DDNLTLHGFGTEILTGETPDTIWFAGNPSGSAAKRSPCEYERFGTRHRSMMRYCASHPESIGFVVSQDGAVRAISAVDGEVTVWDNISLLFERRPIRRPQLIQTTEESPKAD
ncbi:MAG: hypothetical protein ABSF33_20940, partial [Acidimicrobiales bacterium]